MNKLFLPSLLGVFMLFFSGKPVSKLNCGPRITIYGLGGGIITEVNVLNHTTGNITVYSNPTFPITHIDQGTVIVVSYYLNGNYHFVVNSERADGVRECQMNNFHDKSVGAVVFRVECTEYFTQIGLTSPQTNWGCP